MKIRDVHANNRKKAFEIETASEHYTMPYSEVRPSPTPGNPIIHVGPDPEMGNEGFTYTLTSGEEGAVHLDHILDYNKDPAYMADLLMYKLTVCAQKALKQSKISTRELIRRLDTSPAQFYRLLDQTNYRKSMHQLLSLLHLLGQDVDITVKPAQPLKPQNPHA